MSGTSESSQGADLHGADLHGADLHGADLHGADLTGADLHAADLTGADLHAADLTGADLRETRLRGANLCDTAVGWGSLGHPGGDPELSMVYDPAIRGARADDETQWPVDFGFFGMDIAYDGPAILRLVGEHVDVPAQASARLVSWGSWHSPATRCERALIRHVGSWWATVDTSTGITGAAGDRLLMDNLRLLIGQPALHGCAIWKITGHDQRHATLAIERKKTTLIVPAATLFPGNVRRWWWHVPGTHRSD